MNKDPRHRTIYLLQFTDETGQIRKAWYATKRQAEIAARLLKSAFQIKSAKV
jgi:hypothetical protein